MLLKIILEILRAIVSIPTSGIETELFLQRIDPKNKR